jgi:hypothetical protein
VAEGQTNGGWNIRQRNGHLPQRFPSKTDSAAGFRPPACPPLFIRCITFILSPMIFRIETACSAIPLSGWVRARPRIPSARRGRRWTARTAFAAERNDSVRIECLNRPPGQKWLNPSTRLANTQVDPGLYAVAAQAAIAGAEVIRPQIPL